MENLKVLYSKEELNKRIKELAQEIDENYNGEEVIAICVLKGAVFFATDLLQEMKSDVELEFIQVSSYQGTESTGKIILKQDISKNIEGKNVLIIEDIIDTGHTMKYLKEYLLSKNPKDLKIVVLLDKKERRQTEVEIDYTGFIIPNKFVVGYGFDIDDKCRNIPYVGYIDN